MRASGLRRWVASFSAGLLLCLVASPSPAESPVSGHLKLFALPALAGDDSFEEQLGYDWMLDGALDFRLMFQEEVGRWRFDLAYRLSGRAGDQTESAALLVGAFPDLVEPPADSWFDLRREIHAGSRSILAHELDRASVSYSTQHAVARVGRQALTWGNGVVFKTMDLFTPFSFDAVDVEYKPGTDMVYGQWLFDRGDDVQGVVAPRRDPATGEVESALSSYAVKWYRPGRIGLDVLAAEDWGDGVLGLGLTGSAGGSVWRVGSTATFLDGGETVISGVANWNSAFSWGERATQWFVEAYWNGFGVPGKGPDLSELPAALQARLRRGQVFVVNRPYLVSGVTVQWTPLLMVSPSLIVNLRDGSVFSAIEATRDLSQRMLFSARLDAPLGPSGTEFGGLPPSADAAFVVGLPTRLVVKLAGYF